MSKERKYFGTDGMRGLANQGKMSPEMMLKLGIAAGRVFQRGEHRHRVVIGKDTRLSGYMIEPALTSGFAAAGMDVFLLGPLPTPAMAMLTRSLRADIGVMISASHNPFHDNGVKFFDPNGHKLSDETELQIEALMDEAIGEGLAEAGDLGRVKRIEDAGARYVEYAKSSFPKDMTLDGLRIVLDCANGAAYKVAPKVLWELGAEVIEIGNEPNGFNINRGVGSTAPKRLQEEVLSRRADIGIALDGDADRVIICDEKGQIVDGDQVMATIAKAWHAEGKLRGKAVAATVMSNMGFEHFLKDLGLEMVRTKVGDRYVMEAMREQGLNIGGEPSGHVILTDYATTGDGIVTGLQILAAMNKTGLLCSALCDNFEPWPNILENVRYGANDPLEHPAVQQVIADNEKDFGADGRIVIRKSGTEPLVRVMAEGRDARQTQSVVDNIVAAVKAHL